MSIECTTILGTFVGGIIGWAAGYFNAKVVIDTQKFNNAATNFKSAFVDEIRFIDDFYSIDRSGRDIPNILRNAIDKHEKALAIFICHLSSIQRRAIKEAWQNYTGEDKHLGKPTFRQYSHDGTSNRIKHNVKLALKNLNAVLEFAKHK